MYKRSINILLLLLFYAGMVMGQVVVNEVEESKIESGVEVSVSRLTVEEQVEQLILDAFGDTDGYVELLDKAQALAKDMPEGKSGFFEVYINQSKLRIAASKVSVRLENGEEGVELSMQARLLAKGLAESAEQMEELKAGLNKKLEDIKMYNRKQRGRMLGLISRCEYSNGWVYYSISTIAGNGLKEHFLSEAEKIFTRFLAKDYQAVNLPVMVNCLYGKGLCLRDSGRYYDLLVMLDTMSVSDSNAVKFARLRLAASVKLSLSVEILRVVQEYFEDDAIDKRLTGEELEMLVNCIEAGVRLLDRDLPIKMKMSLRKQLVKAIDRTEGYGQYWQDRVSDLLGDLDLKSPYVKLLQAYDESADGRDYEKIFSLADDGLKLCDESEPEKKSEFLYLKVISSWNSKKFDDAWGSAYLFMEEFPGNVHSEQVAGILCQVSIKIVEQDRARFKEVYGKLAGMLDKGQVDSEEYMWTSGCLLINAGEYKEGYEYFHQEEVVEVLEVKSYYGMLLAVLPMMREGELTDREAVDSVEECCREFTASNGSFVQTSHFVEAADIICEIASELLGREKYDLAGRILGLVEFMPHIRGEIFAKYMGVNISYRLAMGGRLDEFIDEITSKNLHNDPKIFNLLVSESRKLEMAAEKENELLIRIYRLLLSSKLLDDKNAVAVRIYLAQCYYGSGDYVHFLNLAESIVKSYPMHVTVVFYRQMAVSYREEGDYVRSAEYWNMVLQNSVEMKEGWKEALYNKIFCYNKGGEREKASQIMNLALLRRPELLEEERFKTLKGEMGNE